MFNSFARRTVESFHTIEKKVYLSLKNKVNVMENEPNVI